MNPNKEFRLYVIDKLKQFISQYNLRTGIIDKSVSKNLLKDIYDKLKLKQGLAEHIEFWNEKVKKVICFYYYSFGNIDICFFRGSYSIEWLYGGFYIIICKTYADNPEGIIRFVSRLYEERGDIEKHYMIMKEKLKELEIQQKKEKKAAEIARMSICAIVAEKMSGTEHEWFISEEKTRSVLLIKTKCGKMLEITLGHKSFTKKISVLTDIINQFETFMETLPYAVNIKDLTYTTKSGRITWNKGSEIRKERQ
ncbi:MAG: hypothetical protein K5838_08845 [Elusimicrobiales bacterium]|nr:hypothetical protein [Elusimicrobiales bacterium]